MIFTPLSIPGAWLITAEPFEDNRGAFYRSWDSAEVPFDNHIEQANVSVNRHAMTLRGLHYQLSPHAEAKTLTCIQGWADDVIVDLRPTSPTYLKHEKVILREGRGVHIPEGCANAFLTRQDMTIFHYCCSAAYHPESERGLRWNDPVLDIKWYGKPRVISAKDAGWPLLGDA